MCCASHICLNHIVPNLPKGPIRAAALLREGTELECFASLLPLMCGGSRKKIMLRRCAVTPLLTIDSFCSRSQEVLLTVTRMHLWLIAFLDIRHPRYRQVCYLPQTLLFHNHVRSHRSRTCWVYHPYWISECIESERNRTRLSYTVCLDFVWVVSLFTFPF